MRENDGEITDRLMRATVTYIEATLECVTPGCQSRRWLWVKLEDPANWREMIDDELSAEADKVGWNESGECPNCIFHKTNYYE